jgi:hypothetical protein
MHRFPQGLMATSIVALAACGAPGGLNNEDQFPPASETGYLARDGIGASGAGNGGSSAAAGSGPTAPPPGSAGSDGFVDPAGGASGTGNSGVGGSDVVEDPVTDPDPPDNGADGCPPVEDLLARPAAQGGCTGGCHEAGRIVPDLTSPNVGERLLNLSSMCSGRPYIGADDSFLAEKIAGGDPECGFAMPYLQSASLSSDDRECILEWVDRVASGGS